MTSSEDSSATAPAKEEQNPKNAAEGSDASEGKASDQSKEPPKKEEEGLFLAPHGNALGEKIEAGLSPIGKPLGKGLGVIASPVGGLVDPIVGGLLRSGGAYGEAAGVGAGNMDKERAEEQAEEYEKKHTPVGGKEQTGANPLGLNE